jgi:hypothetical protein
MTGNGQDRPEKGSGKERCAGRAVARTSAAT